MLALAADWRPQAIVHLATEIPTEAGRGDVAAQFAATNRLRTEGTRILLAAAEAAGGARLVSQSIAFVNRPGEGPAGEEVPLRDDPGDPLDHGGAPIAELERLTLQAAAPSSGSASSTGRGRVRRRRRLRPSRRPRPAADPPCRGRSSTFSFVHADDAGSAVVSAVASDARGVFNIVDDEPAPVTSGCRPSRPPAAAASRGGSPPGWRGRWPAPTGSRS